MKKKFSGTMVGCGVGDAIGEVAFSHDSVDALKSAIAQRKTLTYTDDMAMALGLAASLVERGQIEPEHLGETFRANYEREPWRGYAMTSAISGAHLGIQAVPEIWQQKLENVARIRFLARSLYERVLGT